MRLAEFTVYKVCQIAIIYIYMVGLGSVHLLTVWVLVCSGLRRVGLPAVLLVHVLRRFPYHGPPHPRQQHGQKSFVVAGV